MIPCEIGGWVGSERNYNTLLIIIGPENCKRLAIVAKIPDAKNNGPKYFLKDDKIFLGCDCYQL